MQNVESRSPLLDEYVLDSYALLAYFEGASGSEYVCRLLDMAEKGRCHLYMCVVNLGEVIYIIERERGLPRSQETLARIDELPVDIIDADRSLVLTAAHIKADNPIAYADCFTAALAQVKNASLVTGDPEFRDIESKLKLRMEWLPDRKQPDA